MQRLLALLFLTTSAGILAPLLGRSDPWEEMFEQPLVKWALMIGEAKSLPWRDPAVWDSVDSSYDVSRVPVDALQWLAPDTPVLVRMETFRRAIVYGRQNPGVAYQLLAALVNRVQDAEASGKVDPLALFDLGYFFEACRQAPWLQWEYLGDRNGYALVMRAIQLRGASAPDALEMQFAAGLILLEPKGQHPYYPHFKTVVKAVQPGSLLEKNLVRHLSKTFEADTLDAMRKSRYLLR